MLKIFFLIVALLQVGCANSTYYYQNNKKVLLTPSSQNLRSVSSIDYYTDEEGRVLGINNALLVKLKEGVALSDILDDYNLTFVKELTLRMYLLTTTSKEETISIANQLYESGLVEYAHPDFLKKRLSR
jgi:hypothetical protein